MYEPSVPNFEERLVAFASADFAALRPGQQLVLSKYAGDHLNTSDLAIEMPTGEGKTLVALLIADYALDQGRSVAYLTGTRQLAERVEVEASKLGLDVVRFASRSYGGARLDDYHQAQAVGVMNYWVYFNSQPIPQPADLVIFDHLAEQPLSGLQTLRIPDKPGQARELYQTICNLVIAHTDAYPGLRAMHDGTALPGTSPELLSFSDWSSVSIAARDEIERSAYATDNDIKWVWPRVRDHLNRCGVLIGSSGIEMRPYHPPTALNPGYSQAKQRIYLSATLGSMDDLQRRIGGARLVPLVPDQLLPDGATGERRFVLNPSSGQPFDDGVLGWALDQAIAAGGRAAWLCASHAEADMLQRLLISAGQAVFRLRHGDDDTVESWSHVGAGHLVTSGRYDGLDLPGDICKLVIITTVPQASSEFERFVVAYLGDASHMRHRVGQRVTQALGRANRTATDRSLYLGLDPTFAQILADPAVRVSIPEGSRGVIRVALELYDKGWGATRAACDAFWSAPVPAPSVSAPAESETSTTRTRKPRPGRAAGGNAQIASANAEVSAATDLWIGDHVSAVSSARQAADQLASAGETEHAAFWRYVEAHAYFDRGRSADLAAARSALEDATKNGPRTTWFRRLERTIADLAGHEKARADDTDRIFLVWDEWRREAGARLDRVLSDGRAHLTGNHDQQCEGLKVLARLAGAIGERPPKAEQSATDCRWSWSTVRRGERRVWEVKTSESDKIPRDDINQLLGQVEVESKRATKARVLGCLLTPVSEVSDDAGEAAHDKVTLVHHPAAVRLFDILADRFRQYAALCGDGSAEARGEARTKIEALLPTDRWLDRLLSPSQGKVIGTYEIAALFPPC
ncbi:MAG: DEAD/DEAH box helicase [Pseudonocardiaceae bacterium]